MAVTRADLLGWLASYKRDFNGLCQALAWQVANKFGSAPVAYSSAKVAYQNSQIISKDPNAAPAGSFHYWSQPSNYWHVAPGLGGSEVVMATSRGGTVIGEAWQHIRVTTVQAYGMANYMGWSYSNGRNDFDMVVPSTPSAPSAGGKDWYTSTEVDGKPGTVYWQMLDIVRGAYTRDRQIIHMVSQEVNRQGYGFTTTADVDGVRGKNYWKLVQLHGNKFHRDLLRRNGFPNGLVANGIPGPGSQLIEYQISAWAMNQAI